VNRHYIYLIPGFFGFANLGGITYFHHVRQILTDSLCERDVEPIITYIYTSPTGSIRDRASRLHEQIARTATDPDAPIHLIGHSTGGLDARLLTSPGALLLRGGDAEAVARRVKSVVSIATPHMGTPVAQFFNGLFGQNLLYLLSLLTIYGVQFGKMPLKALFKLIGILSKLDDYVGQYNNVLDQFYHNLFADFDDNHVRAITDFLELVRQDQDLLGQLTPGGMDLFNAVTKNRDTVRYGCVVTQGRRPDLAARWHIGRDIYLQASHTLYALLYRMASGRKLRERTEPTPEQARQLVDFFGSLPSAEANDGMVPTWSQLHGTLLFAAWADHLDVCGHFNDANASPPHVDWLASGSSFRRPQFNELWRRVSDFIVAP
jgi:pimeloyl-ACP methyl ester carboxylesterase